MYLLNLCKHIKTCIKKRSTYQIHPDNRHKSIHCCKSRFSLKDKGPRNNIPSRTFSPKKQQRCNLDRYSFVYVSSLQGELLFVSVMEQITLKNSVLVVKKKQHDFVAGNVPNRMRSSKKKKITDTILFIWILALPRDGAWRTLWCTCHLMRS